MADEAYRRLRSDAAVPEPAVGPNRSRLRIIRPSPRERYASCVPLLTLRAAAGVFGDVQQVDEQARDWVAVEGKLRLRPGMFVAQVVGKSMEPRIPDGSYCLFAGPVEGSRQGRIVLVQHRDIRDPDTEVSFTVKRYESEKIAEGEDSWRHSTITLQPVNPAYRPIILEGVEEGELSVVAELVDVLGTEPPAP
jgi:SOS-response transcriptional repressor LexA